MNPIRLLTEWRQRRFTRALIRAWFKAQEQPVAYSEFRFWSPMLDADAIRISMPGHNGGEFFRIIRADEGRRYRERRDDALALIQSAIEAGLEPGEVFPA